MGWPGGRSLKVTHVVALLRLISHENIEKQTEREVMGKVQRGTQRGCIRGVSAARSHFFQYPFHIVFFF